MTLSNVPEVPSYVVISPEYIESDVSDYESEDDVDMDESSDVVDSCSRRWEGRVSAMPAAVTPRKPERARSLRRPRCGGRVVAIGQGHHLDRGTPSSQSPRCPKRQASNDSNIPLRDVITVEMSLRMLLQSKANEKAPRHRWRTATERKNARIPGFQEFRTSKQENGDYDDLSPNKEDQDALRDILPPRPRRVRSFNKSFEKELMIAIDALHSC